MKILKYLTLISFAFLLSCSEDIMDEVNIDQNNPAIMDARNLIPDLILKSAFETTATDIAWYATVYIEHAAGTWGQSNEADRRVAQNSASMFNNSWNNLYDVMNIAKTIIDKTDPVNGEEPDNYWVRAIGQILMAYNLGVATDMWGELPYREAFQGMANLNPGYDKQSDLYPVIIKLLDDAIVNLDNSTRFFLTMDKIYGDLSAANNVAAWKKFAYALKARHSLRLTKVDVQAAQKALNAIPNAFASAADQVLFRGPFAVALGQANPWGEFWWSRNHLSVSSTIHGLMTERNDPRMAKYFYSGEIAPIGTADNAQNAYAGSRYTTNWNAWSLPITLFTFQELKFIEAEAKFRTGAADWQDALEAAIRASWTFHGQALTQNIVDDEGEVTGVEPLFDNYIANEVLPRLTAGNELQEIMTQKYIALYDREAIEVYNDYRRTGFPEMKNPNNTTTGFVHRLPYALSEVQSNSANVPSINVHVDKVWWAGGSEN
jgi:hypothetical protein